MLLHALEVGCDFVHGSAFIRSTENMLGINFTCFEPQVEI